MSGALIPNARAQETLANGKQAIRTRIYQEAGDVLKVDLIEDGDGGIVKNIYQEVTNVAASSETTIVSYTVPIGKTFYLKEIHGSGDNRARFTVEVDGVKQGRERTYNTVFNANFHYYNLEVTAGKVIRLTVFHNRSAVNEFDGRIIGNEK